MSNHLGVSWTRWTAGESGFAAVSRASVLALGILWSYQAWVLGWTEELVGTVAGSGAWSLRDSYAGHGWRSLVHLSVVNVAKAVMVVPLLVVLVWSLIFPKKVYRLGPVIRSGVLVTLGALFLFSYLAADIPFNFYGSRYYLPIVLPLVILTFAAVISAWSRWQYSMVAVLIVAASVYHTYGLVAQPAYQGQLSHLTSVADRARGSDLVFLVGDAALARSTRLAIQALSSTPVVFIDISRLGELELAPTMNAYMRALDAEQATVVADRRLPGMSQERFQLASSSIPFSISFSTYARHRETASLYVSAYRDENTIVQYPTPQWILGGTLKVPLPGEIPSSASRLLVESGGGWLWAMSKSGVAPVISISSNGVELELLRQTGSDYLFALPEGNRYSSMIEIRTNSFIPAEVGINTDPRKLGMDVKSIKFVAMEEGQVE